VNTTTLSERSNFTADGGIKMTDSSSNSVPKIGNSCYLDMVSSSISSEAKANAARRYAEMMIDLFLSEEAKERVGEKEFRKLGLGGQIREIRNDYDKKIIDALLRIKDIGDSGSHYSYDKSVDKKKAEEITHTALGLFDLILIDYFKKYGDKSYNAFTIFSTLFPKVRVKVLSELLVKGPIEEDYERKILHKYILATVKNRQENKARRVLDDKFKKGHIDKEFYEFECKTINEINTGMKKNELPIALTIQDCKRNFNKVISSLNEYERFQDQKIITIISTLLHEIDPSEMGSYIPNKNYIIEIEANNELLNNYSNDL
jgi:hypothetical protein